MAKKHFQVKQTFLVSNKERVNLRDLFFLLLKCLEIKKMNRQEMKKYRIENTMEGINRLKILKNSFWMESIKGRKEP